MINFYFNTDLFSPAGKTPIDVFFLIGQSNAAGRGQASDLLTDQRASLDGTLIYNVASGKFEKVRAGVNTQSNSGQFGPEVGFSLRRRDHNPIPFAIIKYAVGGTGLSQRAGDDWNADSGELALNAKNIFNTAIEKLRDQNYHPVVKCVYWHQGESDSSTENAALYFENMINLVAYYDQVPELNEVPWVICRLFENASGKILVNNQKMTHIATNPARFFWQSPVEHYPRVSESDTTHANAAGQLMIGEDWYNLMADNNIL